MDRGFTGLGIGGEDGDTVEPCFLPDGGPRPDRVVRDDRCALRDPADVRLVPDGLAVVDAPGAQASMAGAVVDAFAIRRELDTGPGGRLVGPSPDDLAGSPLQTRDTGTGLLVPVRSPLQVDEDATVREDGGWAVHR